MNTISTHLKRHPYANAISKTIYNDVAVEFYLELSKKGIIEWISFFCEEDIPIQKELEDFSQALSGKSLSDIEPKDLDSSVGLNFASLVFNEAVHRLDGFKFSSHSRNDLLVCRCFGIFYSELGDDTKSLLAGAGCGSCIQDVKNYKDSQMEPVDFSELPPVLKVQKAQEILETLTKKSFRILDFKNDTLELEVLEDFSNEDFVTLEQKFYSITKIKLSSNYMN